jgi:hypothetical protein
MAPKQKPEAVKRISRPFYFRRRFRLFDLMVRKEKKFLYFILFALILTGAIYPYPAVAMWVGFAFAGYSAIANDSIQTIGTFIASNHNKKWYWLWLFMGSIFLFTVTYSWYHYSGDVTYQRLASKGLDQTPTKFVYLQLAAPIVLLLLTRFRIPVSTTFMLLSVFSTSSGTIMSMVTKSFMGYVSAFGVALLVYLLLSRLMKRLIKKSTAHGSWTVAQWIISGFLWYVWLAQDMANVAVYLPRSLSMVEFSVFAGFIFLGLGFIFYHRGDKIQDIITQKTDVTDVRSATIIDLVYAIILYFFKELNNIPMSTTWVFIGLLAGRELGMRISQHSGATRYVRTFKLIGKDILAVAIGLIISIMLAAAINPAIQAEIGAYFSE